MIPLATPVAAAGPASAGATVRRAATASPFTVDVLRPFLRAHVARASSHARGGARVPLTTQASPSALCLATAYQDPYGDAGLLDADSYAIGYDCPSKTWAVVASDPTGIQSSLLGSFIMLIDRDRNTGTGCSGADVVAVVAYDDTSGGLDTGAINTPDCNTDHWSSRSELVSVDLPDSDTIGIAFPNSVISAGTFDWALLLTDFLDSTDSLPDSGWNQATTPTAPTVPGAPHIGTAKAGDERVAVSFGAPTTAGGSKILSYTADCRSSGGGSERLVTGTGSPISVDSLVNGASYQCRVVAHNSVGTGPWSAWSNSVIPATTPDAPNIRSVEGGNRKLTVAFTAPRSDGGSAIVAYTASCSSSDFGVAGTASATNSPIVVTGVTNGHTYTCHVNARNGIGHGPWSDWSADVMPTPTAPDVPTGTHAIAADGTVTVTYAPPLDDGGSAVVNYDVTLSDGETRNVASSDAPILFQGLVDGRSYNATVVAHNAVGPSQPATSNTVVPAGVTGQGVAPFHGGPSIKVNGTYQALPGDFNGDGHSDLLWYAPGTRADALWFGTAAGGFKTGSSPTINGVYKPVVGDFDGDGYTDVLWYAPGPAPDFLWHGASSGFMHSTPTTINGTYVTLVGDFNGDGRADVLWYAPGARADYLWLGGSSGFTGGPAINANGVYDPAAGDFNGDGYTDLLWYAPGKANDYLWNGGPSGFGANARQTINGRYQHLVGDFDGDGFGDIVWYAPGAPSDFLWRGGASGLHGSAPLSINGTYQGVPGDISGDGRTDIVWYAPGTAPDSIWLGG